MASTNSSAHRAPSPKITTVTGRKALPPRRDPYFDSLDGHRNASLGFRKLGAIGEDVGTWIARWRGERSDGSIGYEFESLGARPDHTSAVKAAQAWLKQKDAGVLDTDKTVKEVCAAYADAVEKTRIGRRPPRPKAAHTLRLQFARWVDKDPIGKVKLTKLTKPQVTDWRNRLEATPLEQSKADKKAGKEPKPRTPMSLNREMCALRAALNWAHEDREWVANDTVWRNPLKRADGDVSRRTLYLSLEQRKQLLAVAGPDIAAFMEGMLRIPMRPGALAHLNVGDFDRRLGMLTIGKDKAGGNRQIKLPDATAVFLQRQCERDGVTRMPQLPLFCRADGERWHKDSWKHAVKDAVRACGVDAKACAYSLRHAAITDLVRAGVPLSTVAHWAGTSIVMIQRHYSHLVPGDASHGLQVLAAGLAG